MIQSISVTQWFAFVHSFISSFQTACFLFYSIVYFSHLKHCLNTRPRVCIFMLHHVCVFVFVIIKVVIIIIVFVKRHNFVTSEVLVVREFVWKGRVKQKSFDPQFENSQREAFENCFKYVVAGGRFRITKTIRVHCLSVYRQLDDVISDLCKNFAEGTEYFKVNFFITCWVLIGFSAQPCLSNMQIKSGIFIIWFFL